MYNVALTLRLTEENYEKIKDLSKKEKRSINNLINVIIAEYKKDNEKKN